MYTEVKKQAGIDDTEDILKENGVQFPLQNLADLDAFELKIIKNKPLRRAVILKMGHFKPDRAE
jgi:hypothetical protein